MSSIQRQLETLRAETIQALEGSLTEDQRQVVFGEGEPTSPLMVVGEAPGPQEDREGRPFVGRSGRLLNEVLTTLGLDRERLWITNLVKVWPNRRRGSSLRTRPPLAVEKRASRPFFDREVALIGPQVLLALGGTAAAGLLGRSVRLGQSRGRWHEGPGGTPTLVTYHPSYLLRLDGMDPARATEFRRHFTDDIRLAAERAGLLENDS